MKRVHYIPTLFLCLSLGLDAKVVDPSTAIGDLTMPAQTDISQTFPYGITAKTPPSLTKINYEGQKPYHRHRIQLRLFQGCPHIEISEGGRLWATWFGSNIQSERAPHHLDQFSVIATSGDGGKTWQETYVFDPSQMLGASASDPLLWKDAQGRIRFVGLRNMLVNDTELGDKTAWEFIALDPEDPFTEWSSPRLIGTKNMSVMKPLLMPDGTILRSMDDFEKRRDPNEPRIRFLSENPDGSINFVSEQADPDATFVEQMPIVREDGSLFSFYRTAKGQKYMESFDGGRTWQFGGYYPMQFSINTKAFLKKLDSGRVLLIANDVQQKEDDSGTAVFYYTDQSGKEVEIKNGRARMRMTAFLSDDDGKTFPHKLLLSNDGVLSYPSATIGADGSIYIVYDQGRATHHTIFLSKITEEDILAGKLLSDDSFLDHIISRPSLQGGGRRRGDQI